MQSLGSYPEVRAGLKEHDGLRRKAGASRRHSRHSLSPFKMTSLPNRGVHTQCTAVLLCCASTAAALSVRAEAIAMLLLPRSPHPAFSRSPGRHPPRDLVPYDLVHCGLARDVAARRLERHHLAHCELVPRDSSCRLCVDRRGLGDGEVACFSTSPARWTLPVPELGPTTPPAFHGL
jgi:hypothetical protein